MRTIGKSLPNDASSLFTQTDTTTNALLLTLSIYSLVFNPPSFCLTRTLRHAQ